MAQHQKNLFDKEPEPWEADDGAEQLVATVVVLGGPAMVLDYLVADAMRDRLQPGCRVRVPLGRGNRVVMGYCVRLENRPTGTRRLKPVAEIVDRRSLLSPSMLRLTEWIAEHYLCDWAAVLEAVVPAGVRGQAGTRLTTFLSIDADAAKRLAEADPPEKLPEKQAAVLRILGRASEPLTPRTLALAAGCTQAPITALRRKGLIRSRTGRVRVQPQQSAPTTPREEHLVLNPDQQKALDAILTTLNSREHKTVLIHGVTGSGKTEVYIQAIQEVIHFGRQAIVLVPEISLTPQTVGRFRSRFGQVAVLHSHLTDVERHWHWQQIADGKVSLVVGARSAIFAPTPNLGLIVLDEEHESSFKQDSAPRYHARDVAIARASAEDVP
ncbi:MAG: DEAD/DEAH box helicase family protein, partial [Candidatus Nealsonbacteria bacterium]|nr:DEAD/DEAH box helicase family protein [Candidatus Nealsonbacteria bacterium]